ncbi:hypothetical protein [Paenibacillus solani]|uniref:hypothetical protein n=1 Tax=Paenibacillus solani TaxID=1705565 RepID=UPI003D2B1D82
MSDLKEEDDIKELIILAFTDVDSAFKLLGAEDNQYNRRCYIRTVFAAVEALTYVLKQKCLDRPDINRNIYTEAEIALLKEESYTLNNRAEAVSRNNFLPTADNFRFALNMYMRNSTGYKLDLSDGGWELFNKALKIRHRIVHPKATVDFMIPDRDLEIVIKGYSWFNWVVVGALLHMVEYQDGMLKQLNNIKA